jgi:hypothetical protein
MQKAPIALENLTEAEKDIIANAAYAKMKLSLMIYIPMVLIFGYSVYYVNMHYMGLGLMNANLRGFINFMLVILAILPARLLVSEFLSYRKAINAWQKKVFRGKLQDIGKNSVVLVNQKIKVPANALAGFKKDDEVELATTGSGEIFIYLKKI